MNIAIPVWNKRVAPVFDAADRWLKVTLNGKEWQIKTELFFGSADPQQKVQELLHQKIEYLFCGAIPYCIELDLNSKGCSVAAFIRGSPEQILEAFINKTLDNPAYRMPGCHKRRQRQRWRKKSGRE